MSSHDLLNDRLAAFEAKYAHDQDMAFKVASRRDKLFGLWAANAMNKPQDEHDAYAKSVIIADLEEAGDEDVLRKVDADLKAAGLNYSRQDLVTKLQELEAKAKASFMEG